MTFPIGGHCCRTSRRTALLLVGAAALTACSGQQVVVNCPAIRVPQDTGKLTRFAEGGETDITDVVMEAGFTYAGGECTVDDEIVEIAAIFEIAVREGPASKSRDGSFSIFVAVTDLDRNILQRRSLPVTVDFSGNRSTVLHTERLVVNIPKTEQQPGEAFIVFMGFELSKRELAFNRGLQ